MAAPLARSRPRVRIRRGLRSLEEPGRRRPARGAGVGEDEAPGAVGGLRLAPGEAAVSEERRLLVARDARDRERDAEQRGLADDLRGPDEPGQQPRSTPKRSSSSSAQSRVSRSKSIVRDAFVRPSRAPRRSASRRARRRPSRKRAPRAAGRAREQPFELRRGKVGVGDEARPRPQQLGGQRRQRSAVRRSCQTIAGATGRPDARSQRIVVSRWFVIPIAASSDGRIPAARTASSAAPSTDSQSSSGSCSTQPGCG